MTTDYDGRLLRAFTACSTTLRCTYVRNVVYLLLPDMWHVYNVRVPLKVPYGTALLVVDYVQSVTF